MALQKALTYKSLTLSAAYYKVVMPQLGVDKTTMSFSVWVFPSQTASADAANVLSDVAQSVAGAPYSMSGSNPLAQAYEYLKTQAAFAGATSVLEAGQTA